VPVRRRVKDQARHQAALAQLRTDAQRALQSLFTTLESAGLVLSTRSGEAIHRVAGEAYDCVAGGGITFHTDQLNPSLESGIAFFIYDDDSVAIVGGHVASLVPRPRPMVPLVSRREALGSAALRRALTEVADDLVRTSREAMESFLALLPPAGT